VAPVFDFQGMRPATDGQRIFFYVAAIFNLVAAAVLVLFARTAPHLLGLAPPGVSQMFYVDLFAWLVLAFGLGYALGGRDLPRFWPYVAMGSLGKACVAVLALAYFVKDGTGPLVLALASCDAVFAVLFVRILRAQSAR
jgi:hypothetical protein